MCKRNKLKGVWSIFTTPALWAKYGFDGQDGANGADGRPGADGKPGTNGAQGPFVTNRGEYDGTKTYYSSPERIDIVYNKSNNSYYKTRTTAGSFSGVSPTNTTKWELFQGQFENIATGFLFAKEALISSFWFGANRIESQKRDVIIDGNDNGNPRIALGANFNNISNAPTRLYADGRIETSKLVAKDGSDIGNFRISNGKLSNKPNTFAMVQMTDTNMEVTLGTDLVPATAGGAFTLLGRIKNNITSGDAYFRTENIGLELSAQNASVNTALSCPSGNVKINEGSLVVNERSYYSNEGYLNSITANFKNKRTFIFQPTSYNTVMLPSRAEIQTAVGLWDAGHNTGIEIKILITRWATNSINLQGGANAVIIDGRGNIPKDNNSVAHNNGNINLGRGNNCTLYYWNEGWYLTSLNR